MSPACCHRRAVAAQGSHSRPLHGGDADGEAGGDDEDDHLEAEAACDRGREAGCGPVAGADQSVALSLRYGDLAVTLRHGELVVALVRARRAGCPSRLRARAPRAAGCLACSVEKRRARGRRDGHPARRARDTRVLANSPWRAQDGVGAFERSSFFARCSTKSITLASRQVPSRRSISWTPVGLVTFTSVT